jgi:protein-glutamine gamma-glutamyltransferase
VPHLEPPRDFRFRRGIYSALPLPRKLSNNKLFECGNPRLPTISKTGAVPFAQAIERYFQVGLYLMILSAFATLAGTGQVDPLTVLLVICALVARGFLLVRQHVFVLADRWTKALTLFFATLYLVDYAFISGKFLPATVHLVLALMLVRLFSARRDRDYVFLAILSFLLVLAASVLTVDSTFFIAFSGFLLATVATFILLEMRRSSVAASVQANSPGGAPIEQRMGLALIGTVPALVVSMLLIALGIFFFLPRISAGYLSAYAPTSEFSSGFSDRVELGRIGEIQQSNSVVMHIEIDGDKHGSFDLLWRGVALSIFDGKTWRNPQKQVVVPRLPDGHFLLADSENMAPRRASSHSIHYRVLLEPLGTNIFFLAPRAESLQGNYHMVASDEGGAVYELDRDHPLSLYEADSNIARATAIELRSAPPDLPPEHWRRYLQLPPLDQRIAELAQRITANAPTNYDKAAAIEYYLNTNYGYTLQLGNSAVRDPLVNFLFERKQGHCEYFASAMAIMLRTLGIPSRVVNGFRTGEFNDVNSQYLVRARNAHSWVEVYFSGFGWVSFDPTPPAALQTHTGISRIMLYVDAMASFWREWVINYDFGHQKVLGEEATRSARQYFIRIRRVASRHYAHMIAAARSTQDKLLRSPRAWAVGAIVTLLLLMAVINAQRIWFYVRSRRLAAHPEKSPQQAAALWYARMTHAVARLGWKKSPTQTPSEFIATIEDATLRQGVERFTQRYEHARFGDSADDARLLPELYQEIAAKPRR